ALSVCNSDATRSSIRGQTISTGNRGGDTALGGGNKVMVASFACAYFVSCTNARLAAWVGMDLNDFPARSCCWSSTLFSHVAKLTLTEAIAERMVRAMEIASCTLDIAPMGLKPDIAISTLALAILYPMTNFSLPLIPSVPSFESSKPGQR